MIEVNLFKKSFFMGRLVWVKGPKGAHKIKIVHEILNSCQVRKSEVFTLETHQFVDMVSKGLDRETIIRYEVFLVRGFENLSADLAERFLKCIDVFRSLQMGLGIRLILVSDLKVTPDLDEFSVFKPVVVRLIRGGHNPGDLNERVHLLMDQAMNITQKSVMKLSEKAAVFLEQCYSDETDENILALLILGLSRSDGRVLRFRDFIPANRFSSGLDGGVESICN